jgi:hypothetical protein
MPSFGWNGWSGAPRDLPSPSWTSRSPVVAGPGSCCSSPSPSPPGSARRQCPSVRPPGARSHRPARPPGRRAAAQRASGAVGRWQHRGLVRWLRRRGVHSGLQLRRSVRSRPVGVRPRLLLRQRRNRWWGLRPRPPVLAGSARRSGGRGRRCFRPFSRRQLQCATSCSGHAGGLQATAGAPPGTPAPPSDGAFVSAPPSIGRPSGCRARPIDGGAYEGPSWLASNGHRPATIDMRSN